MRKGFMERALEKFSSGDNMGGIKIMRQGLEHYRDQMRKVTGDASDMDVGLLLYAFKTMMEPLKQMVPGIEETEELCAHLFKTVIITVPYEGGDEDER